MKTSGLKRIIQHSYTRKLYEESKKYNDVIDFTLGDPDFSTPIEVKKAAINAITNDNTNYSSNAGIIELREAIAKDINRNYCVYYNPESEIVVTVGAMEALYLSLKSILDYGDEVIIPSPHWINYEQITLMCGGNPIIVDSEPNTGFKINVEAIRNSITDKTVAIIINSPNNPTGNVYNSKQLQELYDISVENNIVIIWDECYKTIVFNDCDFPSILDYPNAKEHTIVINSCSKRASMTGYRLGYMAAPKEVISLATVLQENIVACAPLPSQYAALAVYNSNNNFSSEMSKGFKQRIDVFLNEINTTDKIHCLKPQGTFYTLVDIRDTNMSSLEFAFKLLEEEHVAVVPGITYGKCCEGFVRVACTIEEDKILEGTKRIKRFVNSL